MLSFLRCCRARRTQLPIVMLPPLRPVEIHSRILAAAAAALAPDTGAAQAAADAPAPLTAARVKTAAKTQAEVFDPKNSDPRVVEFVQYAKRVREWFDNEHDVNLENQKIIEVINWFINNIRLFEYHHNDPGIEIGVNLLKEIPRDHLTKRENDRFNMILSPPGAHSFKNIFIEIVNDMIHRIDEMDVNTKKRRIEKVVNWIAKYLDFFKIYPHNEIRIFVERYLRPFVNRHKDIFKDNELQKLNLIFKFFDNIHDYSKVMRELGVKSRESDRESTIIKLMWTNGFIDHNFAYYDLRGVKQQGLKLDLVEAVFKYIVGSSMGYKQIKDSDKIDPLATHAAKLKFLAEYINASKVPISQCDFFVDNVEVAENKDGTRHVTTQRRNLLNLICPHVKYLNLETAHEGGKKTLYDAETFKSFLEYFPKADTLVLHEVNPARVEEMDLPTSMPNLRHLDFSDCYMTRWLKRQYPGTLCIPDGLVNLRELVVRSIQRPLEIPLSVRENLEVFDCRGNGDKDAIDLFGMKNLRILRCGHGKVLNANAIANLDELTLDLPWYAKTPPWKLVTGLKTHNLRKLIVRGEKDLTQGAPDLTKLEEFRIEKDFRQGVNFKNIKFPAGMTSLKILDLQDCWMDGAYTKENAKAALPQDLPKNVYIYWPRSHEAVKYKKEAFQGLSVPEQLPPHSLAYAGADPGPSAGPGPAIAALEFKKDG